MYKNIKDIISHEDANRLAELVRKQPVRQDDEQVVGSRGVWYGLPFCNILLGLLCERVSKESGKKLLPTYTYCRIYTKGNELIPHRDRPSCEWSVTINLAQTESWPLYMDGTEIIQSVGDGALYQGCEVYHWRKPFKGEEYIQVFLHYVDANGPHKNYIYDSGDKDVFVEQDMRFMLVKTNINLQKWFKFSNGFTPQECDAIITSFKGQELIEAGVGSSREGRVDDTIRRSMVFWIPKVKRNAWIYERILSLVCQANEEMYKFDVSEMYETIQFTKYDESFKGKYDWHVDVGGHDMQTNRKISVVVQLTCLHEYEGGELHIDTGNIDVVDKDKGTVIVFPSYIRHRVTEVTKGTRYSLVTWVVGPPFR